MLVNTTTWKQSSLRDIREVPVFKQTLFGWGQGQEVAEAK